jgi:O-antigen/teichoic acid export membrane protein
MSERRSGAVHAATALAIRVASAGLMFVLQILLARLMAPEAYGGYVALWTWMLALGSFAALGFAESSVRFLPRYRVRQRANAIGAFWRFGLRIVATASLMSGALGIAFALGLGDGRGWALTLLLVSCGLPFLALEYFLEGVARSFSWFRLASVPVYIVRPLLIAAICLGLAAADIGLTVAVVGVVLIGSMALVTAGLALALGRRLRQEGAAVPKAATRGQRRLWLGASLPLLLLSGLEDLTSYADILLLSLLADPGQVGIYFAAARSLALAGFVAYAMTLVAGPRFALDLVGQKRSQLQASILDSTRLTLWATVLAVMAAILGGPLLLGAFGPEFQAGQGVMWVLGAGLVVRSMSGQASEVLIVTGRQREGLLVGTAVLITTVLAALVLVPALGIIGAAIASAAGMAVRTVLLAWVLARTEGLQVLSLGLPALAR